MKIFQFGVLLCVLGLKLSSCSHSTNVITVVNVNPLDTIHYSFAAITVHGLQVVNLGSGVSTPGGSWQDSVKSQLERSDTIRNPGVFMADPWVTTSYSSKDSIAINESWGGDVWTSGLRHYTLSLTRDSVTFHRIHVEYGEDHNATPTPSSGEDASSWSYDLNDIPFTRSADNSLFAHLTLTSNSTHLLGEGSSEYHTNASFGGSYVQSSSYTLLRVSNVSSDAYIDIVLKP